MDRLARPWDSRALPEDRNFGPEHCLLSSVEGPVPPRLDHVELLSSAIRGTPTRLLLHPYPRRDRADRPARAGFPLRVPDGQDPRPGHPEEEDARTALRRMKEIVARVQELEEALDDPAQVWTRLRSAWDRAADESNPRMAEIVRQAGSLRPVLRDLESRIRRVLRRAREKVQLDRVQEMDRASMRWLVRQPGRSVAERAGADQRILATVRREDFDTLENRVAHAYVRLAADVAREWLLEHPRAQGSARYRSVDGFRNACRRLSRNLEALGVAVALPGITPNYVLMQDPGYRRVFQAWVRLLARKRIEDDLWAWQAQTWSDFALLAIVLALDAMPESELLAQSPILWRDEAVQGRWFEQDQPLAVFWLRDIGRIVEVQARPASPGTPLTIARAHVALKVFDPDKGEMPRRIAVWTPHAMRRLDLDEATEGAVVRLEQLQPLCQNEVLRNGLILCPAHGVSETVTAAGRRCAVTAIALDGSGGTLDLGMEALRRVVVSDLSEGMA